MNIKLALGISVAVYLVYLALRWFAQQSAITAAYRRELHDLMTNEKYQVKGRFE